MRAGGPFHFSDNFSNFGGTLFTQHKWQVYLYVCAVHRQAFGLKPGRNDRLCCLRNQLYCCIASVSGWDETSPTCVPSVQATYHERDTTLRLPFLPLRLKKTPFARLLTCDNGLLCSGLDIEAK